VTRLTAAPAWGPVVALPLVEWALAHVGGLSRVTANAGVPSWLTVLTGGVLVGASFLFNSLLTDHEAVRAVNGWRAVLPSPAAARRGVALACRAVGVLVLAVVLVASFFGPRTPYQNFAILVVWAGWWAGYAMSTYVVGNTWPVLNPWRSLAAVLPDADRSVPAAWGAWPSVAGLLGLVYVEVVSPLASNATALGGLVAAYTVVTLAGAARYDDWFETVDPVSRVFRLYGRVAPIQYRDDGVSVRLPGTELTERSSTDEPGAVAFVVGLLWVTTFDGLVATPLWNGVARPLVDSLGVGGLVQSVVVLGLYAAALLAGFGAFLAIYRLAAERARESADSFVATDAIEGWFAPSLLPIAAGYHIAHFLGYFLSLSPALASVLAHPLGGAPAPMVAVLPGWFGTLQLAFVVLGHLLAVWVAHALAMDLFPGTLRPIRSQYPFVVVMMVYTMTSALVVGQPFAEPAFL
jgi:hypothetical protein